VARAAAARRPAPRYEDEAPASRPRRAPATSSFADTALRARAARLFFVFVICLAVLGVGRVALSFAVVQKSLQTDTVKVEQRRLEAENADLSAQVSRLNSTTRIRQIAESQLGLVPAERPVYLTVKKGAAGASGNAGR
jgi:cell division protein FtsL